MIQNFGYIHLKIVKLKFLLLLAIFFIVNVEQRSISIVFTESSGTREIISAGYNEHLY